MTSSSIEATVVGSRGGASGFTDVRLARLGGIGDHAAVSVILTRRVASPRSSRGRSLSVRRVGRVWAKACVSTCLPITVRPTPSPLLSIDIVSSLGSHSFLSDVRAVYQEAPAVRAYRL